MYSILVVFCRCQVESPYFVIFIFLLLVTLYISLWILQKCNQFKVLKRACD